MPPTRAHAGRVRIVDSHTEGEPTRVVVEGLGTPSGTTAGERRRWLECTHDGLRQALVSEPRGLEAAVVAYLLPPANVGALAQAVFANDAGMLGMCVHGTIGLAETLRYLDWPGTERDGPHRLETPVGDVFFTFQPDGSIAVRNVACHLARADVAVETSRHGRLIGDIAWGGNWFFLCEDHGLPVDRASRDRLHACAADIMESLEARGIRGEDGGRIDHVELFGAPTRPDCDSKNFVLCPGGQWDRSPCGTGTSAKVAVLAARGALEPGAVWRQESVLGTRFLAHYERTEASPDTVLPTVSGRAWITGDGSILRSDDDPLRDGLTASGPSFGTDSPGHAR